MSFQDYCRECYAEKMKPKKRPEGKYKKGDIVAATHNSIPFRGVVTDVPTHNEGLYYIVGDDEQWYLPESKLRPWAEYEQSDLPPTQPEVKDDQASEETQRRNEQPLGPRASAAPKHNPLENPVCEWETYKHPLYNDGFRNKDNEFRADPPRNVWIKYSQKFGHAHYRHSHLGGVDFPEEQWKGEMKGKDDLYVETAKPAEPVSPIAGEEAQESPRAAPGRSLTGAGHPAEKTAATGQSHPPVAPASTQPLGAHTTAPEKPPVQNSDLEVRPAKKGE